MITKEKTISYIFLQFQQVDELIWLLHFICAAAGVMSLQKAPLLIHSVMRNWVFKNRVLVLEVPSFSLYGFFCNISFDYFSLWRTPSVCTTLEYHQILPKNLAKKMETKSLVQLPKNQILGNQSVTITHTAWW